MLDSIANISVFEDVLQKQRRQEELEMRDALRIQQLDELILFPLPQPPRHLQQLIIPLEYPLEIKRRRIREAQKLESRLINQPEKRLDVVVDLLRVEVHVGEGGILLVLLLPPM